MAAVSVLVVLLVSLLVARVGTVALTLTGMSREAARFQARSAFFGVGFTTGEAGIAGRELGALTLRDAGIVVLGIHRPDAAYVGAPEGSTTVCPGDVLTVYGLEENVEALDRGRAAAV
jgi:Trk K+ transport system NAD-binding subunit